MKALADVLAGIRTELRTGQLSDIDEVIERHLRRAAPLLDPIAHRTFTQRLQAELHGCGPLQPYLDDPTVSEIMVNAEREIWVERHGRSAPVGSLCEGQLGAIVERIIAPLGLRLDRSRPIVDARLTDGSRLCAVAPPIAPDGLCVAIRRFSSRQLGLADFASPAVVDVLEAVVRARCNVVVSGATSSGKTSLLNALTGLIADHERIITIEDTAELRLAAPHVVRLESRSHNGEGGPEVSIGDLVRTALRLRPDRLVVGEVRGAEAVDMVQALNTGHDGSLTTCHANSPTDTLRRLETMVLMGAPGWPLPAVREQLHSSIDVIVHVCRAGQRRRVSAIVEVDRTAAGPADRPRVHPLVENDRIVGELGRNRI